MSSATSVPFSSYALVVVEGGDAEVRHGDARRLQGVFEVGLGDAAAATGACAGQDDEVRVEGDDGLGVEGGEIADLLCVRLDVVIGKRIAGRADERAAGQLPDVREAAHACDDALVRAHGHLVAQVVRKGVAGLLARRALLRAVVAGAGAARAADHRTAACRQGQRAQARAGLRCNPLHVVLLVLVGAALPIAAPLVLAVTAADYRAAGPHRFLACWPRHCRRAMGCCSSPREMLINVRFMGRDRVPPLRNQRFCQSHAAGVCFVRCSPKPPCSRASGRRRSSRLGP